MEQKMLGDLQASVNGTVGVNRERNTTLGGLGRILTNTGIEEYRKGQLSTYITEHIIIFNNVDTLYGPTNNSKSKRKSCSQLD